jgi:SagB-type dehydrogenase family enzyme
VGFQRRSDLEGGRGTPAGLDVVVRYHDGTKHHFNRFARSLGFLDWASQPRPFREFLGAPSLPLWPSPEADVADYHPPPCAYGRLFLPDASALPPGAGPLGDLLRHALGLSAWKAFKGTRWSLRVNPSSGNLHPTEAYVVCGPIASLGSTPAVYHYAPDRHALERRCTIDERVWREVSEGRSDVMLAALTSIHWRESWKYGERAFRYCQHDLGHAVAALALAARMFGWRVTMLSGWSHKDVAGLTGVDRDQDFVEAEREEPGCLLAITGGDVPEPLARGGALAEAARSGRWSGRASQLSEDHVEWALIDEVALATEDPGRPPRVPLLPPPPAPMPDGPDVTARDVILERRSAVAFDGQSRMSHAAFCSLLARALPSDRPPWRTLWWAPLIHLALFVHRVDGFDPGLYLLVRNDGHESELRRMFRGQFIWEPSGGSLPLYCLARRDCRDLAARLSCDQAIAADGHFSLGMLARFAPSLAEHGPSVYRHLFWESGVVGQVLYLEAEAAGARATGIGCFYDDPVHEMLGLRGRDYQSLYHFAVGTPVEDVRLTTTPGYDWRG